MYIKIIHISFIFVTTEENLKEFEILIANLNVGYESLKTKNIFMSF